MTRARARRAASSDPFRSIDTIGIKKGGEDFLAAFRMGAFVVMHRLAQSSLFVSPSTVA